MLTARLEHLAAGLQMIQQHGSLYPLYAYIHHIQLTPPSLNPVLLGMLPTYGGALFSAPIIDIADSQVNINSRMKTFINV
ncbi:MAG: hypothetical protein QXP91_12855 [Candidatus Methanomethylicia archaeon]